MGDKRVPDEDVAAFLKGDPETHAAMRQAVRAVVSCFHLGSAATQEDLVQEALYRTFLNLRNGAFRGEASLKTFGQKIAEYTCLEHLRRMHYRSEVDPAAAPEARSESGPESLLLRAEEHRRNLRRLAGMSGECRELFRLIFIERLSYVEVARRCGISETAVKLRVYRCRILARDAVEPRDLAPGRPGRKEVGS